MSYIYTMSVVDRHTIKVKAEDTSEALREAQRLYNSTDRNNFFEYSSGWYVDDVEEDNEEV
jgi:hypothetical protein